MSSDGRYNDEFSTPLEPLLFGGSPNEDVTDFLRAVKRVAVIQRRQRDDEWMIDYVESCLKGQAMRWFDALPPATVESWSQVRRAFLARFDEPLTGAPTPAAATPAGIARPLAQAVPNAPLPSEISLRGVDYKTVAKVSVFPTIIPAEGLICNQGSLPRRLRSAPFMTVI